MTNTISQIKEERENGKGIAVIISLLFSITSFFVVKYADSNISNILACLVSSVGVLVSVFSIYNDRYSLKKLFCGTTPSEDLKDRSKPNKEIEFLNLLTNLDGNEFSSLSNEAKNYFAVICSKQLNLFLIKIVKLRESIICFIEQVKQDNDNIVNNFNEQLQNQLINLNNQLLNLYDEVEDIKNHLQYNINFQLNFCNWKSKLKKIRKNFYKLLNVQNSEHTFARPPIAENNLENGIDV